MLPRRRAAEALFSTGLLVNRIWAIDLFGLHPTFFKKNELVANIEKSWISIFSRNLHSRVACLAGAEIGLPSSESVHSLLCHLSPPLSVDAHAIVAFCCLISRSDWLVSFLHTLCLALDDI